MYQAAKAAGEDALILYQIEAAVLQIGQEIFQGRSVVEFKQWVDQAMKEMGASFQMQISERRHRSFSKGSITFRKRSR